MSGISDDDYLQVQTDEVIIFTSICLYRKSRKNHVIYSHEYVISDLSHQESNTLLGFGCWN